MRSFNTMRHTLGSYYFMKVRFAGRIQHTRKAG